MRNPTFLFSTKPTFLFYTIHIGSNYRMGDVGCELAAVYNTLLFYDYPVKISNIIFEAEQRGYIMSDGKHGTNPYKLNKLLKLFDYSNRLKINQYKDYKAFVKQAEFSLSKDCIFVVSYWNDLFDPSRGIHTVAFYTKTGSDVFYAWNYHAEGEEEVEIANLDQLFKKSTFVLGYMIVKLGN